MFFACNIFCPDKFDLDQGNKNGNLDTWPDPTAELIFKYPQKLEATNFGHLYGRQKNTRSTKIEYLALDLENAFFPSKRGNSKFGICRYQLLK